MSTKKQAIANVQKSSGYHSVVDTSSTHESSKPSSSLSNFEETQPFEGTGWPRDIFVDPRVRNRKLFYCTRNGCEQRILKDPQQLACGHRMCKACIDLVKHSTADPICYACVSDIRFDDAAVEPPPLGSISDGTITNEERRLATIVIDYAYPDTATTREIGRLAVRCPWSPDCEEKLIKLKELEDHMKGCKYRMLKCTKCQERVRYNEAESHLNDECDYREVVCPFKCGESSVVFKFLQDHKLVCKNKPVLCTLCHNEMHHSMTRHLIEECRAPCPLPGCEKSEPVLLVDHFKESPEKHLSLFMTALQNLQEPVSVTSDREYLAELRQLQADKNSAMARVLALSRQMDDIKDSLEEHLDPVLPHGKTIEDLLASARNAHSSREEMDMLERVADVLANDVKLMSNMPEEYRALENQVAQQEANMADNLRTLDSQMTEQDKKQGEMTQTVDWLIRTGFKGHLVWRIENVSTLREAAKVNPIHGVMNSPAFFLGRYSYKMAARLYLLGDGSGKGTHISLYFTLLRGEYDDVLRWPFQHRVTFILKNQRPDQIDIIERFKPDRTSSSFTKPTSEANIASGCPQFARQALVYNTDAGYVVDDVMFIEVIVDPSSESQYNSMDTTSGVK